MAVLTEFDLSPEENSWQLRLIQQGRVVFDSNRAGFDDLRFLIHTGLEPGDQRTESDGAVSNGLRRTPRLFHTLAHSVERETVENGSLAISEPDHRAEARCE
jgi:hypothetical protein